MLVHVKTPPTDLEISGSGTEVVIEFLKEKFKEITIRESTPFEEMDWYREIKNGWNGAIELRTNRDKFGLTQKELGDKVGVSKQFISDLENGRKSVSVKLAKSLGVVFERDYRLFL